MSIRNDLKARYEQTGDTRFAAAIKALDEWDAKKKKTRGAKKKWRETEQIELWASVQALLAEKWTKTITGACKMLIKGEGWGYPKWDEARNIKKVVITNVRRLNRLYNETDQLVRDDPQVSRRANATKQDYILRLRQERIEAHKKLSESKRKSVPENLRAK
jgi:hypothetical protein